ncbi:hypothetical protein M513_11680 [Trichuris suis]|uniref:Uncharacterized protein n=1 Tax=Trichuris suis TaxID=68888 RepID=A0A085LR59_9BILA|nr:hypothetical protein M513_11680 [Trichuris suis]
MAKNCAEVQIGDQKAIAPRRAFDPKEDKWESWHLQFRAYLYINGVTEENLKRICFFTSLAPSYVEELRCACLPKTPFDFCYEELKDSKALRCARRHINQQRTFATHGIPEVLVTDNGPVLREPLSQRPLLRIVPAAG